MAKKKSRGKRHLESPQGDFIEEIEAPISPLRKSLQGTVLGLYIDTKQPRYLLSFISFLIAFVLFFSVVGYVYLEMNSGALLKGNNHELYSKLFTMTGWISSLVTLALLFAARYRMAIQALMLTSFIIYLVVIRP